MVKHTKTIRWQQLMNSLSVFDHSVGLALKGLMFCFPYHQSINTNTKNIFNLVTDPNFKILFVEIAKADDVYRSLMLKTVIANSECVFLLCHIHILE